MQNISQCITFVYVDPSNAIIQSILSKLWKSWIASRIASTLLFRKLVLMTEQISCHLKSHQGCFDWGPKMSYHLIFHRGCSDWGFPCHGLETRSHIKDTWTTPPKEPQVDFCPGFEDIKGCLASLMVSQKKYNNDPLPCRVTILSKNAKYLETKVEYQYGMEIKLYYLILIYLILS